MACPSSGGRLEHEYEQLEVIGKGGFGTVFKVRNHVDKAIYAVKQIRIDCECCSIESVSREARNWAKLTHENVVRYLDCWIRPSPNQASVESSSSDSGLTTSDVLASLSAEGSNVIFLENSESTHTSALDMLSLFSDIDEDLPCTESGTESDVAGSIGTDPSVTKESLQEPQIRFKDLCIKMEFCDETLRRLINEDLYKDSTRVWRLFRQILSGIEYIHRKGILHRDLNPNNIFIAEGTAKIGDFGLSRSHADVPADLKRSISVGSESSSLTEGVGTALYIATEVLSGEQYGKEADLYSIGLVFFEMNYRAIQTYMEKSIVFQDVTQNRFPDDFESKARNNTCRVIRELVSSPADARPSSTTLLEPSKSYLPVEPEEEKLFQSALTSVLEEPVGGRCKHMLQTVFTKLGGNEADISTTYTPDAKAHRLVLCFEHISQQHMGIHLNLPTCISRSLPKSRRAVDALLPGGATMQLVEESAFAYSEYRRTQPASALARRAYSISAVYCKMATDALQYRQEMAFFIPGETADSVAEAEMLLFLKQIVDFNGRREASSHRFVLRVSHVQLEVTVLRHIRVRIGKLNSQTSSSQVEHALFRHIVSRKNENTSFANTVAFGGSLDLYKKNVVDLSDNFAVKDSFVKISKVIAISQRMGVDFDVELHTILRPQFYPASGLKFELVCTMKDRTVKVATGGRFNLKGDNSSDKGFLCVTVDPAAMATCLLPDKPRKPSLQNPINVFIHYEGDTEMTSAAVAIAGKIWRMGLSAVISKVYPNSDLLNTPVNFLVRIDKCVALVYGRKDVRDMQRIPMKATTVESHIRRFNNDVVYTDLRVLLKH